MCRGENEKDHTKCIIVNTVRQRIQTNTHTHRERDRKSEKERNIAEWGLTNDKWNRMRSSCFHGLRILKRNGAVSVQANYSVHQVQFHIECVCTSISNWKFYLTLTLTQQQQQTPTYCSMHFNNNPCKVNQNRNDNRKNTIFCHQKKQNTWTIKTLSIFNKTKTTTFEWSD